MKQKDLVCIAVGIVVAVVALYVFSGMKSEEGYYRNALSTIGEMKRTPVTYAMHEDGMYENPHYVASPSDRLVPLSYGGQDFYKREINPKLPPILRQDVHLVNDAKLRKDMVDSGDMEWHRTLNNMTFPNQGSLPGYYPFEMDLAIPDNKAPLYSESYHWDAILGQ